MSEAVSIDRAAPPEALRRSQLDQVIAEAAKLGPKRVAVVYPCSATALEAVVKARDLELVTPVMVGPVKRINSIAAEHGLDLAGSHFIETGEEPIAAARAAITACQENRADLMMKGSLHTDELMSVVVRDDGLSTARRISHAFVFSLPTYPKLLLMADCVVNISPGLIEKRDIIQNTIHLALTLGIERPFVGILSAVETINPAIVGTVEAAALSKMAERGQITGAVVDGPLGFDIAISIEAARIKGIQSRIPGTPDVLIVPNLEAGNLLYKQLVYLAHADCAGVVLGTKVPIILTSRSDSSESRIASCALAVLHAQRGAAPSAAHLT